MKKEQIHFGDINRWLFGSAPPEFIVEVLIRTIIIYIFLLLVIRLLGKRMVGQITITELSVMVSLGAIVSPVMQLPDRGLLFGVLVLLCALAFQRGLNLWSFKNQKVEDISQGTMSLLVKDGLLNVEELNKAKITRQQLYSMLRLKKIYNLGQVERAYMEACGILTVYAKNETAVGLATLPNNDPTILHVQKEVDSGIMACTNCGHVQQVNRNNSVCEQCSQHTWSKAYESLNA